MLYKTRGIVFRLTRYGETSIIVNIFTEQFGLQSYIVNGVRTSSPRSKIAIYQPLTLLDLVVYHRENANILRIKEAECAYSYKSLTVHPSKAGQAIFITEMLNRAVKEQSHPQELCEFIFNSLKTLDEQIEDTENFHLVFLLKLSALLGFGPQNTIEILGGRFIGEHDEGTLKQLIAAEYDTKIKMTTAQRRNLLDIILHFYAGHVDSLGEIKSVQVLREILS
jgi:DNA repair protein RecO (recombination protein O)